MINAALRCIVHKSTIQLLEWGICFVRAPLSSSTSLHVSVWQRQSRIPSRWRNAADSSDCAIPENVLLQFPCLAVSGDVAVVPNMHANLAATSDVFRSFNNLVDTGLGTGVGILVFLYSGHNELPPPSTYSVQLR